MKMSESAAVNRKDTGQAAVETIQQEGHESTQLSRCGKVVRTSAALLAFLATGLCISIIGSSLLDLQLLTDTSTSEIALIFTVRGVMALLSSIFMGPIFDKIDRFLVCGLALLVGFLLYGAAPWSTNLPSILVTLGLPEFNGFAVAIGTNLICLEIWKEDSGPFLQALNFFGIAGFMVGPLLAQPFLSVKEEDDTEDGEERQTVAASQAATSFPESTWTTLTETSTPYTDSYNLTQYTDTYSARYTDTSSVSTGVDHSLTTIGVVDNATVFAFDSTTDDQNDQDTDVKYALWIVSAYCLSIAIFMLGIFLFGGHKIRRKQEVDEDTKNSHKDNSRGFVITVGILVFFFNVFYAGIEIGYSGLLMAFAVDNLNWSKTDGTWLLTSLQASNCFVTGMSIVLAKFLRPNVMLGFDIVILNASLLVGTFLVETNDIVLWVCSVGVGIGSGVIMPCTLTWLDEIIGLDGKFSSVYWTGYAAGYMALPAVSGFLFKEVGKMWFMYINLISGVVIAVIFVLMSIVISKNSSPGKTEDTRL